MALDVVLTEALHRGADDERSSSLLAVVSRSLDAMAAGGIYDHVGGGFARYSVDERWLVPHFEKMLYDQALLVRVYAHAAAALDSDRWRNVVSETVAYVVRELRQPGGAFGSAEDADSPGPDGHNHEGLFYTWTPDEVAEVVGSEAGAVCELLRHHRRRQLHRGGRGAFDPQSHRKWPDDWRRPDDHRGRPAGDVRRREKATPGARRQGADGVERLDDLRARRGR